MSLWKDWQATTGSECGQKLNSFCWVDIQFSDFMESIFKSRAAHESVPDSASKIEADGIE